MLRFSCFTFSPLRYFPLTLFLIYFLSNHPLYRHFVSRHPSIHHPYKHQEERRQKKEGGETKREERGKKREEGQEVGDDDEEEVEGESGWVMERNEKNTVRSQRHGPRHRRRGLFLPPRCSGAAAARYPMQSGCAACERTRFRTGAACTAPPTASRSSATAPPSSTGRQSPRCPWLGLNRPRPRYKFLPHLASFPPSNLRLEAITTSVCWRMLPTAGKLQACAWWWHSRVSPRERRPGRRRTQIAPRPATPPSVLPPLPPSHTAPLPSAGDQQPLLIEPWFPPNPPGPSPHRRFRGPGHRRCTSGAATRSQDVGPAEGKSKSDHFQGNRGWDTK